MNENIEHRHDSWFLRYCTCGQKFETVEECDEHIRRHNFSFWNK